MNGDWIGDELRKMGARDRAIEVPPEIETRVMAAFDTPPRRERRLWLPALAAAAAIAVAFAVVRPEPVHRVPAASTSFVAIPYVVPPAPYERTRVVRMEVPAATMIAAGFGVHFAEPGAAVRADVLIGQDGRALALRPVSDSERTIDQ
jgi:hypothetical protein